MMKLKDSSDNDDFIRMISMPRKRVKIDKQDTSSDIYWSKEPEGRIKQLSCNEVKYKIIDETQKRIKDQIEFQSLKTQLVAYLPIQIKKGYHQFGFPFFFQQEQIVISILIVQCKNHLHIFFPGGLFRQDCLHLHSYSLHPQLTQIIWNYIRQRNKFLQISQMRLNNGVIEALSHRYQLFWNINSLVSNFQFALNSKLYYTHLMLHMCDDCDEDLLAQVSDMLIGEYFDNV